MQHQQQKCKSSRPLCSELAARSGLHNARVSLTTFLLHPHALASLSEPPDPWTSSLQVCLFTHPWRKPAFLAHPCSFFYLGPAYPLTLLEKCALPHALGRTHQQGMGQPGEAELGPASKTRLILVTALTLPWVLAVVLPTSGGSVVKNLPAKQEMRVQSLGWEDLLEEEMATHSSILAWRIP